MEIDLRYDLNPKEDMHSRKLNAENLVERLDKHYIDQFEKAEVEWRDRWETHCKDRTNRFLIDEIFDRVGYQKSDIYKKRERLMSEKREIKEAQRINQEIRRDLKNKLGTINISKYANEKGDYFLQRFKELREERGIHQSYEIAFYLLGDENVIDDMILGEKQKVTHTYCEAICPNKKRRPKNKNLIGWAHSHADFNTFYSSVDNHTMESFIGGNADYIPITDVWEKRDQVQFFYGIVFNEAKDAHALRLLTKIPQYSIKVIDGKIEWKVNYLDLDFETTPSRISNNGYMNNWIQEELFDDERILTDEEKLSIDEKILDIEIETGHNRYKKLSEFKIKEELVSKVEEESEMTSNDSLESKIFELQKQFNNLQEGYQILKQNYDKLLELISTIKKQKI